MLDEGIRKEVMNGVVEKVELVEENMGLMEENIRIEKVGELERKMVRKIEGKKEGEERREKEKD